MQNECVAPYWFLSPWDEMKDVKRELKSFSDKYSHRLLPEKSFTDGRKCKLLTLIHLMEDVC